MTRYKHTSVSIFLAFICSLSIFFISTSISIGFAENGLLQGWGKNLAWIVIFIQTILPFLLFRLPKQSQNLQKFGIYLIALSAIIMCISYAIGNSFSIQDYKGVLFLSIIGILMFWYSW